jgi:hypothetical protein
VVNLGVFAIVTELQIMKYSDPVVIFKSSAQVKSHILFLPVSSLLAQASSSFLLFVFYNHPDLPLLQ